MKQRGVPILHCSERPHGVRKVLGRELGKVR
eukprot:CAMPEP_0183569044 /NCGR_PEP_ID=MMETSP0371-20130417/119123_1 /TAXON_ID=268820 /ORGANISM="Peridinium aciculiferum, Strain PAER-2" /LENGTH=30 /DNA_ID= /DNA_START= /DNA_END= /DNA_ORIENTATION=